MKLAIMQPYFLPYIGYFQLMNAVDKFVVWDKIKYTKKGWINRNRYLLNEKDTYFTIPLKKDSDFLDIRDRFLSDSYTEEKDKLLNKILSAYRDAPFFEDGSRILESLLNRGVECLEQKNLFSFIFASLVSLASYFDMKTEFIIASEVPIDHSLKGEAKVIAICKELKADHYINPKGGADLYHRENFGDIRLSFLFSKDIVYKQFGEFFVPWLSILDIIMFNSKEQIKDFLTKYELR